MVFVRHFEKYSGDNPSLTEIGQARADALAHFFSDRLLNYAYLIMSTQLIITVRLRQWLLPSH
jgi:broad specificity phosphatase PhoE